MGKEVEEKEEEEEVEGSLEEEDKEEEEEEEELLAPGEDPAHLIGLSSDLQKYMFPVSVPNQGREI